MEFTARKQPRIALSTLGTGQEATAIIQQPSEAVGTPGNTNHSIAEASEQGFKLPLPARVYIEMRIGLESTSSVGLPRDEARSVSTYPSYHDGGKSSNV